MFVLNTLALVCCLVAVAFYYLSITDFNQYKTSIEGMLRDKLGRYVYIDTLQLKLGWVTTLNANNVVIGGIDEGSESKLFSVEEVAIKLKLFSLLSPTVKGEFIVLKDGYINIDEISSNSLAQSRQQQNNTSKFSDISVLQSFDFKRIEVERLQVNYSQKNGEVTRLKLDFLNWKPLHSNEFSLMTNGTFNNHQFKIVADVNPPSTSVENSTIVDLKGTWDSADIVAKANVVVEGAQKIQLNNLQLSWSDGDGITMAANGGITNIYNLEEIDINVALQFKYVDKFLQYMQSYAPQLINSKQHNVHKKILKNMRGLVFTGHISGQYPNTLIFSDVLLKVGTVAKQYLQISGKATTGKLKSLDGSIKAHPGYQLNALLQTLRLSALPKLPPFTLDMYMAPDSKQSHNNVLLNLKIKQMEMEISGKIKQLRHTYDADLEIKSHKIDISSLQNAFTSTGNAKQKKQRRQHFFSQQPIFKTLPWSVNINAALDIKKIYYKGLSIGKLKGKVLFDEQSFRLKDIEVLNKGKTSHLNLYLSAQRMRMNGKINGFDNRILSEFVGMPKLMDGDIDAILNIEGGGNSAHQWASSSNGKLSVSSNNLIIKPKYLVGELISKILNQTWHSCLLSNLTIEQGVAQINQFDLASSGGALTGKGSINLKKESLSINLNSNLSLASGLMATGIPIELHGSFMQPKVNFSQSDLTAKINAPSKVALNLLSRLLGEKNTLKSSDCATSLAQDEFKSNKHNAEESKGKKKLTLDILTPRQLLKQTEKKLQQLLKL